MYSYSWNFRFILWTKIPYEVHYTACRSQWPRSLRHGSVASRLLGLWVRIPPEAWMSLVSVVCFQVEVSVTDRSLVQMSPTECGVSECDLGTSIMMRSWLIRAVER
jgi:hypothetical protein